MMQPNGMGVLYLSCNADSPHYSISVLTTERLYLGGLETYPTWAYIWQRWHVKASIGWELGGNSGSQ
jgi:hypothetical protein